MQNISCSPGNSVMWTLLAVNKKEKMNVCYLTTTGKSTAHRNQKVQMTVSNAVSVQKENLVRISLVFFLQRGEDDDTFQLQKLLYLLLFELLILPKQW